MKKIILLSSLLLSVFASAQLSYDFEDGTTGDWIFNLPVRWRAENLSPITGSYSLHHSFDNSESSSDAAMFNISGLCPACETVTWEFAVRHGTDPSSSNKWSFILMSDAGPGEIAAGNGYNGFAVGVNLKGYDDTLRLWLVSDGEAEALITTGVNWQTDVGTESAALITVMRTTAGEWTIDLKTQGSEHRVHGLFEELIYATRYAGILYTYTSARDRLMWIDDVSVKGVFIADTLPPSVISVTALRPDILQVMLDEETDMSHPDIQSFSLSGDVQISDVVKVAPVTYELKMNRKIPVRIPSVLTINELCDQAGNCSSPVTIPFTPVYAVTGDVVISEIMADPSPPVKLPDREYIEITNRTDDSLSIYGWRLIATADTAILPMTWIRAGESIILCSASGKDEFSSYGRSLGLASFPSVNDSGEIIALRDGCGSLVHAVSYTPALFIDPLRSGGGFSAELTDMNNPFNEAEAWRPSVDPSGGTPGRANSAETKTEDNSCPEVIAVWPEKPGRIKVLFGETVIMPEGVKWLIDGDETMPAVSGDIADRSAIIPLERDLTRDAVSNLLIPSSVADFAGNRPCLTELKTGLPSDPGTGEILFNELLFDPVEPCTDFIELYNSSDHIFDLSELSLANGTGTGVIPASGVPRQLLPGKYLALTTERDALLKQYQCADRFAVHETGGLPSMPDGGGSLVLYDSELNIIDRVDYSSSMHLLFLSGTEGITLEKVSPDLSSGISGNWHSASEVCGWGTPGAENSNLLKPAVERNGMQLSSSRVSPDCDGFEDAVSVDVFPGGDDNVIAVTIFSDRGYVVRKLAERFAAGEGARFIWDGTSDSGARLPAGLYMIMAETFNAEGVTKRWKEACALVYR